MLESGTTPHTTSVVSNINRDIDSDPPCPTAQLGYFKSMRLRQDHALVPEKSSVNFTVARISTITALRSNSVVLAGFLRPQNMNGTSPVVSIDQLSMSGGKRVSTTPTHIPIVSFHVTTPMNVIAVDWEKNAAKKGVGEWAKTEEALSVSSIYGSDTSHVMANTEATVAYMFAADKLSAALHDAAAKANRVNLAASSQLSVSRSSSRNSSIADHVRVHSTVTSATHRSPASNHSPRLLSRHESIQSRILQTSPSSSDPTCFEHIGCMDAEALDAWAQGFSPDIKQPNIQPAVHLGSDIDSNSLHSNASFPTAVRSPTLSKDKHRNSAEYNAFYLTDMDRPSPLGSSSSLGHSTSLRQGSVLVQPSESSNTRSTQAMLSSLLSRSARARSCSVQVSPAIPSEPLQAWAPVTLDMDDPYAESSEHRDHPRDFTESIRKQPVKVCSAEYAAIHTSYTTRPCPLEPRTMTQRSTLGPTLMSQATSERSNRRGSTGNYLAIGSGNRALPHLMAQEPMTLGSTQHLDDALCKRDPDNSLHQLHPT